VGGRWGRRRGKKKKRGGGVGADAREDAAGWMATHDEFGGGTRTKGPIDFSGGVAKKLGPKWGGDIVQWG